MAEESKIRIPQVVQNRLVAAQVATSPHPDANLLAAFSEHVLTAAEQKTVTQHLAQCPDCRSILHLSSVEVPADSVPLSARSQRAATSRWGLSWVNLRWGALAALLAVVVAAVVWPNFRSRPDLAAVNHAPSVQNAQPPVPSIESKTEANKTVEKIAPKRAASSNENSTLAAVKPKAAEQQTDRLARRDEFAFEKDTGGEVAAKGLKKEGSATLAAAASAPAPALAAEASNASSFDMAKAKGPAAPAPSPITDAKQANVSSAGNAPASSVSETVEVTSQSSALSRSSRPQQQAAPKAAVAGMSALQARTAAPNASWRIRNGHLERSLDAGGSWTAVKVPSASPLRAVVSAGSHVWTAGVGAVLYHSSDGGATWSVQWSYAQDAAQQNPTRYPNASAVITRIDFSDPSYGSMRVKVGGSQPREFLFTSNDGGQSWLEETID